MHSYLFITQGPKFLSVRSVMCSLWYWGILGRSLVVWRRCHSALHYGRVGGAEARLLMIYVKCGNPPGLRFGKLLGPWRMSRVKLLISARYGNPMRFVRTRRLHVQTPTTWIFEFHISINSCFICIYFVCVVLLWEKITGCYLLHPIELICVLSLCSLGFVLHLHWCVF